VVLALKQPVVGIKGLERRPYFAALFFCSYYNLEQVPERWGGSIISPEKEARDGVGVQAPAQAVGIVLLLRKKESVLQLEGGSEGNTVQRSRNGTQRTSARRLRSDAGKTLWTPRDEFALAWIGHQYGIRLDQLQWLLGRFPGRGAANENWISEGAARDVVTRWQRAKLVRVERIRVREPFWVWPTRLGLRKVGLPYTYRDLAQSSLDDLTHLYAINEIRLQLVDDYDGEGTQWVSERQLLQGVVRSSGQELLHRPDGEIYWADGTITAVEAELSLKKPFELAENLMELLRGKEYLRAKADFGWQTARGMSRGDQSQYAEIWYFAPSVVRRQVRRERARLVSRGDLSEQEAERIFVRWYPLATEEESEQEEAEDDETLDNDSDTGDQPTDEERHPEPEGEPQER